jgi:hypothetical protein
MKSNVGSIDKILRIIVGIALIALAATGKIGVWGYIGVIPLLTGLFNFCPAYSSEEHGYDAHARFPRTYACHSQPSFAQPLRCSH